MSVRLRIDRVQPVTSADQDLLDAFDQRTGHPPAGVWAAPGRVNLIGEHTDYNDGFVMPFALAQRVRIAAAPRDDGRWQVSFAQPGLDGELRSGRPPARNARLAGLRGRRRLGAGASRSHGRRRRSGAGIGRAGRCGTVLLRRARMRRPHRPRRPELAGHRAARPRPAGAALRERVRRRADRPDGPGGVDPVHRRPRAVLRLPQLRRRSGGSRPVRGRSRTAGARHQDPPRARGQRVRRSPPQLRGGVPDPRSRRTA